MFSKKERTNRTRKPDASEEPAPTSNPEGPPVVAITPWDMLALERSEHAQAQAHAAVMQARLEKKLLAAMRQLQDIETSGQYAQVSNRYQEAAASHRKLAQGLAERYNFSWDTHSYQPETGEVSAANPET